MLQNLWEALFLILHLLLCTGSSRGREWHLLFFHRPGNLRKTWLGPSYWLHIPPYVSLPRCLLDPPEPPVLCAPPMAGWFGGQLGRGTCCAEQLLSRAPDPPQSVPPFLVQLICGSWVGDHVKQERIIELQPHIWGFSVGFLRRGNMGLKMDVKVQSLLRKEGGLCISGTFGDVFATVICSSLSSSSLFQFHAVLKVWGLWSNTYMSLLVEFNKTPMKL